MTAILQTKYKKSRAWLVAVIILLFMVTVLSVFFITSYIKKAVFFERDKYLSAQTDTIGQLINSTMIRFSDYAVLTANVISSDIYDGINLSEYIEHLNGKMDIEDTRIILVDEFGTWYGENGTFGRITSMSYYEDTTDDFVTYMTRGVDADIESIVFRVRLSRQVNVETNNGTSKIKYVSVIWYLDDLQHLVDSAFPYTSNSFIIDDAGFMLFSNYDLGILIEGTNIFTKIKSVIFTNGYSSEFILDKINNNETISAEFFLNGKDYFICVSSMILNDWHICYVVPSESLSIGSYVSTISIFIFGLSIIFISSIVGVLLLLNKVRIGQIQLETQQQANIYLEQASKAKSLFLSNMSHDIRTPINGILGMVLMAKKENNSPKTEECLNNIDKASNHLLSLVNDVLDMSSIESGKIVLSTKPANIYDVIDNCLFIINGQMQNRDLEIIKEYSEISHPDLMIDVLHIQQIFINILSNAVKYTPDGGKIYVRLSEKFTKDHSCLIHFEIEDTGIGMKEEFINKIWDAFSQENGGSRTKYKGTGLGMSITKRYVELFNGTIVAESEYNKGSKFTVELPFEFSDMIIEENKDEQDFVSIIGMKILVAEDNELNLLIIKELLSDAGAKITCTVNGKEALDNFISMPPGTYDALLFDILMPEMSGIEAAVAIRNLDREDAKTIPIIAMTANAFDEDIQATKDAGMNEHLSKPINLPLVINTLSKYYIKGKKTNEENSD